MSDPCAAWLTALLPPPNSAGRLEQRCASVAAFLAPILTGLLCTRTGGAAGLLLIAPMGASAVLLLCLPARQPAGPAVGRDWRQCRLGAGRLGLRQVRPRAPDRRPAGRRPGHCRHVRAALPASAGRALALTAVLAGPAVHELGIGFAVTPVARNCVPMVGGPLLVNKLTGRRYPHRQQSAMQNVHDTADAVPTARLGFRRDDLEGIILATEAAAYGRRFGVIRCGQIMSADVVTLEFGTALADAWGLMRHRQVHALPVLNRARRVIGIVTQSDLVAALYQGRLAELAPAA